MTDEGKKRGRAAIEEIDLRLEGLLGKLGATLGDMLDGLERGESGEMRRIHDFQTARGPVRAETGVRIRMGLGGESSPSPTPQTRTPRPASAARPSAVQPASPQEDDTPRPVAMEAYAADGRWVLTADLPGVTLDEVAVTLTDGTLSIQTTGRRRYAGMHPLPPEADPDDMANVLRNGILEISMALREGGA